MANAGIAIILGIMSTSILHLAKGMQRQGIEIFNQIKSKIKRQSDSGEQKQLKKPIIYTIGFILNQTIPIFYILSNALAGEETAPYFTSMFGLGLVVLMVYSTVILKEHVTRIEGIGSCIIIIGTLILGIENISRGDNPNPINKTSCLIIIGIYIVISLFSIFITLRNGNLLSIGIALGIFSGGLGCIDPVLKAISQGDQVLPTDPGLIILFILSFFVGFAAFLVSQWAFYKKINANVIVPSYNCSYIILPIIIYALSLEGYFISFYTILGLIMIFIGIIMMQAFKESTNQQS